MSKVTEESRSSRFSGLSRVLLPAACVLVLVVSPLLGIGGFPSSWVFWQMRLPRVLAGFIAGAGLSLCGMGYQGMFRNSLATPYTLGVSGGAALGVALVVRLHWAGTGFLGLGATSVASFTGALGAMVLVWFLSRLKRTHSPHVLLLSGVATSFFFSSLIMFLHYVGTPAEASQVMRWLMGGLDLYGYDDVAVLAIACTLGGTLLLTHLEELNLLAVSDDFAASRGVDLRRTKLWLHLGISVMVGMIVSLCGPIGFVGMVSPHISRLLVGGNHKRLAPACLLFGGGFLVFCDTLGRLILPPAEIPVGVVTALLGGPFFLWLLLRR